ncbi:hypothetical protein TRIATDRAFT_300902 [Trichoderma atroviride IMI 206040]|uniref:Uncharacterized protein n=1 Tax=Hypocrea atroviridis (strain ATCC 20476 / IMI 206040) TaxID=452589 RepID=G9P3B5_HYPAI|nr:uncharacterized protein TRIATDRAFT_300902 [Trichoderma atroviride IMI 206040]EHK42876.1 hypothetical protein TRIATDRAFT_300902 [Trichoderma atroviride IMI 206040]
MVVVALKCFSTFRTPAALTSITHRALYPSYTLYGATTCASHSLALTKDLLPRYSVSAVEKHDSKRHDTTRHNLYSH